MMNTTTKRKAFIGAAVAKMQDQKFDGYNLDIELGGDSADARLYTHFVTEFADALHVAGGALSSDSTLFSASLSRYGRLHAAERRAVSHGLGFKYRVLH